MKWGEGNRDSKEEPGLKGRHRREAAAGWPSINTKQLYLRALVCEGWRITEGMVGREELRALGGCEQGTGHSDTWSHRAGKGPERGAGEHQKARGGGASAS